MGVSNLTFTYNDNSNGNNYVIYLVYIYLVNLVFTSSVQGRNNPTDLIPPDCQCNSDSALTGLKH